MPGTLRGFGFIALALFLTFVLLGCVSDNGNEPELEAVSVRLPIPVVEAGQTPFYVAEDLGFYEAEGLDLSFNMGSPELNPVKMVALSTDDFGVLGGPDTLLVARANEKDLMAVAVFHKNSNFPVILTLKESGLETLQGLEGKRIGFFYGHISTDILRALLHKEDIDYTEVDVGFDYSQLISGQIDAEWAFRQTAGITLPSKDVEINVIQPADYGVVSHGYTIFARGDFIEKNPEVVEKFLRATLKGLQYSLQHPEESVDILVKRDPKLDREIELQRLMVYNGATSKDPYGFMSRQMFEETAERLLAENVIEEQINIDEAFDASFVQKLSISD
jgi:NitT/TauT family transport system substrate-binding protein